MDVHVMVVNATSGGRRLAPTCSLLTSPSCGYLSADYSRCGPLTIASQRSGNHSLRNIKDYFKNSNN